MRYESIKQENNSKYGDAVVELFSESLSLKYGRGFRITNIKSSINFYNVFKKKSDVRRIWKRYMSHCGEIAKQHKPYGIGLEKELGRSVISKQNSLNYEYIDNKDLIG